jgi:hypothetical protein
MRRPVYDAEEKHIPDRMHRPGTQCAGKVITRMVSATLAEKEEEHGGLRIIKYLAPTVKLLRIVPFLCSSMEKLQRCCRDRGTAMGFAATKAVGAGCYMPVGSRNSN